MGAAGFWDDAERAASVSRRARARVAAPGELPRRCRPTSRISTALAEMAAEDASLAGGGRRADRVGRGAPGRRSRSSGCSPAPTTPATRSSRVNAGAGGTDAQDWAEMVLRMEMRWAERRGFEVELLEVEPGRGSGHQVGDVPASPARTPTACSAPSAACTGSCACRRSTPRTAARRASPASRWRRSSRTAARSRSTTTTCRSTPTAPRAPAASTSTRPTRRCASRTGRRGIVVQCQNERSQSSNRATAMAMLRAKLLEREERERQEEIAREKGEAQDVNFGSQIRSYVLHPYTMVKDHRTGHEMGDVQRVLDGDLDALRARLSAVGGRDGCAGSDGAICASWSARARGGHRHGRRDDGGDACPQGTRARARIVQKAPGRDLRAGGRRGGVPPARPGCRSSSAQVAGGGVARAGRAVLASRGARGAAHAASAPR